MDLESIKLEYKRKELNTQDLNIDPAAQLEQWMTEAITSEVTYPNAVTLATVTKDGFPQCRVVLVKEFNQTGITFYTNYKSPKGEELARNPKACINFFWKELDRQVRVTGEVVKTSKEDSKRYFLSRPLESQISALASPQGQPITKDELLQRVEAIRSTGVKWPEHWGGYLLKPISYEFWQGRPNRLHDSFRYFLKDELWEIVRVGP